MRKGEITCLCLKEDGAWAEFTWQGERFRLEIFCDNHGEVEGAEVYLILEGVGKQELDGPWRRSLELGPEFDEFLAQLEEMLREVRREVWEKWILGRGEEVG